MDLPRIRDLKDLQAVLDLMKRNDLAELEIEEEGRKIRLRKTEPRMVSGQGMMVAAEAPHAASGGPPAGEPVPDSAPAADDALHAVRSPLVGTFYRAPSPEAEPFVQEGDRVEEDSVLCIVEAMKVMNEIRCGVRGIVREILMKNGEPVEFGQPLLRIETE